MDATAARALYLDTLTMYKTKTMEEIHDAIEARSRVLKTDLTYYVGEATASDINTVFIMDFIKDELEDNDYTVTVIMKDGKSAATKRYSLYIEW